MCQFSTVHATFPVRALLITAAMLLPARSAQAVKLVVMNIATNATNSAIPAGEQVVTFGIQVMQSDLYGAGTNPVLSVHNLTFAGNGIVPINVSFPNSNRVDVQDVQTHIIDVDANNNAAPVTENDMYATQRQTVYADSWWYNSPTGVLQGVNDIFGDVGDLTNPTWQTGPVGNVGTTGYTWTPNGLAGVQAGGTALAALGSASGTNATTGQYMIYSGTYGPAGANSLTYPLVASQFYNGMLTVPIAQIATTGNILLPGTDSNAAGAMPGAVGSGTYIELAGTGVSNGPTGNGTYNVLGGFPFVDPHAYYSFIPPIPIVPEPSSIVFASLGAFGFLLHGRFCRTRRTSNQKTAGGSWESSVLWRSPVMETLDPTTPTT